METTSTATDSLIRNLAALGCILQGKDLPELPFIMAGAWGGASAEWYFTNSHGDDPAEQRRAAEAVMAVIGGSWTADATAERAKWTQRLDGVTLLIQVARTAVCERVVVGTHEVTVEVPDPAAPRVTVTKVVEDVEWRCIDDLAEMDTTAVAS